MGRCVPELVLYKSPVLRRQWFPYYDIDLDPASIRKRLPKALRRIFLASAAADQLDIRDSDFHESIAQFAQGPGEVHSGHRQRVVLGFYVETGTFQVG